MQKCEYSLQFHWIDKGNKDETMYDLNGPRKLHNWSPNLVFCLMNMQNSNTLLSYLRLHDLHTPDHWLLDMEPVMTILTHVLCQHGEPMQKQKIKQLTWVSNVQTGFFQGIYDTRSEVLRTEKAYSTTKGVSAHILNYMMHIILHEECKPRFNKPKEDHVISCLIMSSTFFDVSTHVWCVDIYQHNIRGWHRSCCTTLLCGCACWVMATQDFQDLCRCRHFDLNREEEREDESKSVCFHEKLILQAIVLLNTTQSFQ